MRADRESELRIAEQNYEVLKAVVADIIGLLPDEVDSLICKFSDDVCDECGLDDFYGRWYDDHDAWAVAIAKKFEELLPMQHYAQLRGAK